MNPLVLQLITSFFMHKGKPNKVLGKLGPDVLGAVLESTFKDGAPNESTLDLITKLNGGKKKGMTAEQKKAMKFLSEGGAKRSTGAYVMHELVGPALAGGARTVGNTLALQYAAPAAAAQAAANGFQVNPAIAQGTVGGKIMSMAMPAAAAAHQGVAAAKGALATGIGNTIADTTMRAVNASKADDLMQRQTQNMMAQRTLSGVDSKPSEGEWNYMNQQMKAYNAAGGAS